MCVCVWCVCLSALGKFIFCMMDICARIALPRERFYEHYGNVWAAQRLYKGVLLECVNV